MILMCCAGTCLALDHLQRLVVGAALCGGCNRDVHHDRVHPLRHQGLLVCNVSHRPEPCIRP